MYLVTDSQTNRQHVDKSLSVKVLILHKTKSHKETHPSANMYHKVEKPSSKELQLHKTQKKLQKVNRFA